MKKNADGQDSESIELHAAELIGGQKEHCILTDIDKRLAVFENVYNLISKSKLTIINVLIDKSYLFSSLAEVCC